MVLDHDPDWWTESRVAEWLDVPEQLVHAPALPAAAIALHSWDTIEPFQQGNAIIGRLLIALLSWRRGKV